MKLKINSLVLSLFRRFSCDKLKRKTRSTRRLELLIETLVHAMCFVAFQIWITLLTVKAQSLYAHKIKFTDIL